MTLPWATFNANEIPEQESIYEPLKAGNYPMVATSFEQKTSKKDPNSWYLNVEFTVLEGAGEGRKVFNIFNLGNVNETARNIANSEFAALCKAIKLDVVSDPSQILNKPFTATLNIKKDEQYGDKNEIKKFLPYGAAATAVATQSPQAAESRPAWKQ